MGAARSCFSKLLFIFIGALFAVEATAQDTIEWWPVRVTIAGSIGGGAETYLHDNPGGSVGSLTAWQGIISRHPDGGLYGGIFNVMPIDEVDDASDSQRTFFRVGVENSGAWGSVNASTYLVKTWNPSDPTRDQELGASVYVEFLKIGAVQPFLFSNLGILEALNVTNQFPSASGLGATIATGPNMNARVQVFGIRRDDILHRFFSATAEISKEVVFGGRPAKVFIEGGVERELGDAIGIDEGVEYEFTANAGISLDLDL